MTPVALSPERVYEARGAGGVVLHRGELDPTVLRGEMIFPAGIMELTWSIVFLDEHGKTVNALHTPWGLAMLRMQRARPTNIQGAT